MVLLIIAAVVVAIVLVLAKVISLAVALLAILVVIGFAAWQLDRGRTAGARAPFLDANRPDLYGQSSRSSWDTPTPYIDHPTGAGEPPGVDRGDEPAERR